MARKARQISLRECYQILKLDKGADLEAVKKSYRKRAFELHPDLNPGNADASREFQLLNEAYVALSAMLKASESAKGKEQEKTESKSSSSSETEDKSESASSSHANKEAEKASAAYAEQDVLRDLLNDPFARRVFEDIYSQVNKEAESRKEEKKEPEQPEIKEAREKKPEPILRRKEAKVLPLWEKGHDKGVKGMVKDWLRRQIDDEQTLRLPSVRLAPGRKVRLQIRRGISDEISEVEVTLPSDFTPGKPVRLRGLGKRIGPWQGDLYLTILPV